MDITNTEYFRIIRKAIENKKLAVFIGSAVSYDSNLPSWEKLINAMKGALEIQRTNDYLKIAEHYYLQYGRNTYYNKINEFFPSGSQPNKLHESILSLKPQHIITTNWDDLLEKAITKNNDLYFTVADDHELASAPTSQLLVKMHGDLNHRNIVFKESDYLSYSDHYPLIENFVKSLFSTHVVVFIGYSISDYNLNQIIKWVRNRTNDAPPAFTILTEEKITISESNYLREKGIYPILCNHNSIPPSKYTTLSKKSESVLNLIKQITNPTETELPDIISEISNDISHWSMVHPSNIVKLIKDRLNLTKINKIYYSPEEDIISYAIDRSDLNMSRNAFRNLRKDIIKILYFVPIKEIHLRVTNNSHYKIINKRKFNFISEFTEFNFKDIKERISSTSSNIINDVDMLYQNAYDNYYLKKLNIARESFSNTANLYFSKSLFINSLLSSFNKKQLCFGEIPWELYDSFLEISQSETLSQNDNISDMIEKFPKSIVNRQKALFQDLDSNNSFLLQRFKEIANLSRAIDEEIDSIKNGSMVFSNRLHDMYKKSYYTVMFVLVNKITILYSSDFRIISKISFESIVKRQSLNEKIVIDEFVAYMAIISFKERELIKFLTKALLENKSFHANEDTKSYLMTILNNTLNEISSPDSKDTQLYCQKIWSNTLALLSFINLTESEANNILIHSIEIHNTSSWFDLSENLNKFLVLQFNRYKTSFSKNTLKTLFFKQIEKLNTYQTIPIQMQSQLFHSVLHLIREEPNSEDIFSNNDEVKTFVSNVSKMDLKERIRAIDSFIFTIYSLATGQFKNEISNLLLSTFEETKHKETDDPMTESIIIFELNLYILKIINDNDLDYILKKLKLVSDKHIKNGSASSSFTIIKDQINSINQEKLVSHKDLVENVTKISDAMKMPFHNLLG